MEDAAFYSYAYPAPEGFAQAKVRPADAFFDAKLGEFILPYEAVRRARDPGALLHEFLWSTYDAAASLGGLGPLRARVSARAARPPAHRLSSAGARFAKRAPPDAIPAVSRSARPPPMFMRMADASPTG